MVKIAFISDIHGNAVALESVLKDIERKEVDKIVVLGDLCFRGPEPKRSLEIIRNLNTDVIKGNADEWVIRGVKTGEVPDQALTLMNEEIAWILNHLDNNSIEYLKNLPTERYFEYENMKIHAFHATPNSLFDVVLPSSGDKELEKVLMDHEADVFIYAHIHKPFIRTINGKCIMNIGSVGLPLDGLSMPSYGVLEFSANSWEASIVRVRYDVNSVINKFSELDYPNFEQMKKILLNAGI